jgi:hypothetical protein
VHVYFFSINADTRPSDSFTSDESSLDHAHFDVRFGLISFHMFRFWIAMIVSHMYALAGRVVRMSESSNLTEPLLDKS